MKEKKNIDRLFQEQLRDFEATPDNQVWLNIEAELKKDKKRKVIPLWLRYSGIAAAFLLGLFILNTNQMFNSKKENPIVLNSKNSSNKKQINPQNGSKKVQIAGNSKENSKHKKEIIITNFSKPVVKDEKEIKPHNSSNALGVNKKNQNNADVFLPKDNLSINQPELKSDNNRTLNPEKNGVENSNSLASTPNQTLEKKNLKENEESQKQPSINPESPNELEEILKAKSAQKKAVASNSKNKWQITPNVAPVYLNANSGGSPIDEQLSDYEKKSDNSLSFGLGLRYAVNNKLAIRTGVNKVVLGYNTNNVLYSTGLTANNLKNIQYPSDNVVKLVDQANYSSSSTFEKEIQKTNTGTLNQKMGYFELPMEVSYAVLDKKFGINLIGGFSTLFLNENTISLVSSQSNIELGQAKNLNQVHFSTNVGLGFKYQILKSFQINLEPMVKYQLNTFSNNSGDFKPLFIGLYSGISYGF
ncbi:MAG: outer membrane beta-barrel protein [Flavobacterium sp.]|nr:outer membrane beta-barrel protein [Flavobacterium sp.]